MLWIVGVLVVYLLALFAIAWISLHPYRIPTFISPGSMGAPQEDVTFKTGDILLRGWWVEAVNPTCVIVCAHGYMMNKCELTPEAFHLWKRGCSCLVMDFRAHGKSGGKKSGLGFPEREDIRAAVAEVRRRAPGAKVGLYGSSMGSAASALACGDDPTLADFLILDSCYCRLSSAILGWWRFLGGKWLAALLAPSAIVCAPMGGFNPFKVNVSRALAKLKGVPVLFFHGESDNLALPSEAKANFEACTGPKQIVWFPGCGHSEGRWLQPEKYRHSLMAFLEEHAFIKPSSDN